jgi:CBS domain-containing protein
VASGIQFAAFNTQHYPAPAAMASGDVQVKLSSLWTVRLSATLTPVLGASLAWPRRTLPTGRRIEMATRYDDREYDWRSADRGYDRDYGPSYGRGYSRSGNWSTERSYDEDRGLLERAGDEVRSWFGDDEAERRRRLDNRRYELYERESDYGRSRHNWNDMRAGDVMTRNVVTIYGDETLTQAARLMQECDCGALPVVNNSGHFIGMITDRDIAIRGVGRGTDPRYARVEDCMTRETFACHVNDTLRECLEEMSRHQVRRVPVLNDRNQVIGIISQADVARRADAYQGQGGRRAVADVVAAVSEPSRRAYR